MYVHELIEQLEQMPPDLWVDVMFPDDMSVYTISEVSQLELSQGEGRVVIDIVDDVPMKVV